MVHLRQDTEELEAPKSTKRQTNGQKRAEKVQRLQNHEAGEDCLIVGDNVLMKQAYRKEKIAFGVCGQICICYFSRFSWLMWPR